MRSEMKEMDLDVRKTLPFAAENAGFPEFSESPDFVAPPPGPALGAKSADELAWIDSKLLSPEIRQLVQGAMRYAKA